MLRLSKNTFSTPEILNPSSTFNPYCARFFEERFIVGSGRADMTDMSSWSSISADIVSGSSFVSTPAPNIKQYDQGPML
jgi:hypothetical protein